ncbi:MAG: GNAT family N-acetyltransferase [Sulfitobacter sp.]|nr:GNAT family N-acetyltransferase [Sulfitobacter sp.]
MIERLAITPVPEDQRALIDTMAHSYFRELLPDGPPYVPQTLDRYWMEPGRHPYLITLDGTAIGFALVWNHADGFHELVEFTIQPAFRHRGLGTEAATMIFEALGGDWILGVAQHSPGGMTFWENCLNDCETISDIVEGPPRTAHQQGSLTFRVAR